MRRDGPMPQSPSKNELGILLVDDEEQTLKYFVRALGDEFQVFTAVSADAAESLIEERGEDIAVVISDQRMPGKSGITLLDGLRQSRPDIIRILTTAYGELSQAIEAVNRGEIFRYITKPWDFEVLRQELKLALYVHQLESERKLLIAEKLHVRDKLRATERAQMLFVSAAAVPQLKHAKVAIVAYVRDVLSVGSQSANDEEAGRNLELWSDAMNETALMSRIASELSVIDALLAASDATKVSPREAWSHALPDEPVKLQLLETDRAFDADARKIEALFKYFISGCRNWLGPESLSGPIRPSKMNRSSGFTVQLRAADPAKGADGLLRSPSANAASIDSFHMLFAYILAYELGGAVRRHFEPSSAVAELELPYEQPVATPIAADATLIDQLFRNFEV